MNEPETAESAHASFLELEAEDAEDFAALIQRCERLAMELDGFIERGVSAPAQPNNDAVVPDEPAREDTRLDLAASVRAGTLEADLLALQVQHHGCTTAPEFEHAYARSMLDAIAVIPSAPLDHALRVLRFVEPDLSALELSFLKDVERVISVADRLPYFPAETLPWGTATPSPTTGSRQSGWARDGSSLPVALFGPDAVEGPTLTVDGADSDYPIVSARECEGPPNTHATHLFEVDVVPTFDSPNCWRTPNLLSSLARTSTGIRPPADTWRRDDLQLCAVLASDRLDTGASFVFPFRSKVMQLPLVWNELDEDDFFDLAHWLGQGLQPHEVVREVFEFVRHCYAEAPTQGHRTIVDTFRTGVGQCGFINGLGALLLELNGLRTRRVSGFNPTARLFRPGGGHTATEVLIDDHWAYWDPYLDILDIDHGVEAIRQGEASTSSIEVYPIRERHTDGQPCVVTLRDLYRCRSHGDYFGRFPTVHLSVGDRDAIGKGSSALQAPRFEPRVSTPFTVHIRAAVIYTSSSPILTLENRWAEPRPDIVASTRWTHTSFEYRPDPTQET